MNPQIPPSLRRAVLLPALLLWALLLCVPPVRAADAIPGEWAGPAYIVAGVGDRPLILNGTGPDPDFTGYPLTILSDGRTRDLAASAAQAVTVRHAGGVWTGTCGGRSFSALLQGLGAAPGPGEGVLVTVSPGHIDLTVSSRLTYYDRDLETTYYQTIRRENPALKPGEEQVAQVGQRGEKGVVYEVEWSNGAVAAQHMVELLDSRPVDEIIEYGPARAPAVSAPEKTPETPAARAPAVSAPEKTPGTPAARAPAASAPEKTPGAPAAARASAVSAPPRLPEAPAVSLPVKTPKAPETVQTPAASASFVAVRRDPDQKSGVLTLPSGETLRFSKSVSMTATAYTTGYDGVGTVTASGTTVHVGVVAVDPKVIPLGTRLYIVANGGVIYGKAVAEDTGVRGSCVDLYMDSYRQCIEFGRRSCMVYILE